MDPFLERFEKAKKYISSGCGLEAVHQGDYIFFQIARLDYNDKLKRLFAFDLPKRKVVLDMLTTWEQSPHSKIDVNLIEGFYTYYEGDSEHSINHIYAITQDQQIIKVNSVCSTGQRDLEEMAAVLGRICEKPVHRQKKNGDLILLPLR